MLNWKQEAEDILKMNFKHSKMFSLTTAAVFCAFIFVFQGEADAMITAFVVVQMLLGAWVYSRGAYYPLLMLAIYVPILIVSSPHFVWGRMSPTLDYQSQEMFMMGIIIFAMTIGGLTAMTVDHYLSKSKQKREE